MAKYKNIKSKDEALQLIVNKLDGIGDTITNDIMAIAEAGLSLSETPSPAPMDLDNNLGRSFDWANATDDFKELMQSIHAVHRKYAAEETSGSWAKNTVIQ